MTEVVAFGEVLWDIIEGVPHVGGAPFSFAAHVVKCGLSASIVSSVGEDDLGRRAREAVRKLGVGDAFSAAFLAAVLGGKDLVTAAQSGNRRAGQVAARAGAIPDDL